MQTPAQKQNETWASESNRHRIELEQGSIFARDAGENIAKAMLDAAVFLERLPIHLKSLEEENASLRAAYAKAMRVISRTG